MPTADDRLARLAQAVADRDPIDWTRESDGADEHLRRNLSHLRLVEKIVEAHLTCTDPAAPDTANGPSAAPDHWGPLRVGERLDGGTYGDVFRAYDPALETDVALKLLRRPVDGPSAAPWLAEARRLARVRHPNVLTVHGAARHDGRVGLWTELLEGKTLEQCLVDQGPFGAHEAALIGIDLCKALAAVHAEGLVHRDVKTKNVIREKGGRIVLFDFSSGTDERLAPGQTRVGTPLYMAPELVFGQDSGPASDIYSLGVLLYRLVSGRFPYEAADWPALVAIHRMKGGVPLRDARPDLPAPFVRVVERAMSADPAQRYPTAGAMERELAASIGAEPGAGPAARPPWYRRTLPLAVAALLALALFGLAASAVIDSLRAPLAVESQWLRIQDQTEERLRPGARLAVDDRLSLEIEGSRPMHVYVLNQDAHGAAYLLFPLPGRELQNPLPPNTPHRLPGAKPGGPEEAWVVTSDGGEEIMLVVASREPLAELEGELANLRLAGNLTAAPVQDAGVIGRLRGVGGLAPLPDSAAGPDVAGLADRLSRQTTGASGVWVWETRFNAAPREP